MSIRLTKTWGEPLVGNQEGRLLRDLNDHT